MEKKRTIQRKSAKKRSRPKVRFNIGIILLIFFLSIAGCFTLYMIAANVNGDFLDSEEDKVVITEEQPSETSTETDKAQKTQSSGISYPLSPSSPKDASYFTECCLVTDSTLLAMASDKDFMEIIGSEQLNAVNCNTVQLSGTSTVCDTVKSKNPKNLYIMLGSDLGTSSDKEMINGVSALVNSVRTECPDTKIYIMQLPPTGTETASVTNKLIDSYNQKLLSMSETSGVYCVDTNIILKSVEGGLSSEFSSENGALSDKGYTAIKERILSCTA